MADETGYSRQNRIIIIALVLVFVLPVVTAWYLVFFTDAFRNVDSAAHGKLIEPPRLLPDVKLSGGKQGVDLNLHGKWTLLAVTDGTCGEVCRENLYRMRQIRLATGKDMNQVQRVLVYNEIDEEMDAVASEYTGQLFLSLRGAGEEFKAELFKDHGSSNQGLFLVDTRGYLMMYYPYDTDPSGIIKDLKRLLRLSRAG